MILEIFGGYCEEYSDMLKTEFREYDYDEEIFDVFNEYEQEEW